MPADKGEKRTFLGRLLTAIRPGARRAPVAEATTHEEALPAQPPKKSGLTLKGGGYGKNWWVGLAFRKSLAF